VRLGFELHGSTAHRIQHPGRDLATDASFLSRQEVSKKLTASFYELAMNDDRFSEKWVPPIEHLTDFVLGGIVLCCSTIKRETIKEWITSYSRRSFLRPRARSGASNDLEACSNTTVEKPPDPRFGRII